MPLMGKLDQAARNRQEIANIKRRYMSGEIDRETAKVLAQSTISNINEATARKTAELNRRYNMKRKPALLDFVNAMRNEY